MKRFVARATIGQWIALFAGAVATAQQPAASQPATSPATQPVVASQPTTKPALAAPQVGEAAPPFKLKSLDGKSEFELTSLSGKRPVLLLFGSYT
ncbi:MAG: hypothetical protein HZB38_00990 [Planctomycetes bacterium]|nr:hypothetical protein [Planctomycetota bacterium]